MVIAPFLPSSDWPLFPGLPLLSRCIFTLQYCGKLPSHILTLPYCDTSHSYSITQRVLALIALLSYNPRPPRREWKRGILVSVIVSTSFATPSPLNRCSLTNNKDISYSKQCNSKGEESRDDDENIEGGQQQRVLRPRHQSSSPMTSSDCNNHLDLLADIVESLELCEAAASKSLLACSVTPNVDDVNPLPLQPPVITKEMLSKVTPSDVNLDLDCNYF